MKVAQFGNTLRIFSDDLVVEDSIPVGTYTVEFSKMSGYSLVQSRDFKNSDKIYGDHVALVDKMIDRYTKTDRNFGAILGGRKGTGKSLSARILSEKLRNLGIPTILVTENTPGLPRFLQSIEQPVLILIDEFEKIFLYDEENDDQSKFLSLFDGFASNRHFYLITINDYEMLSPYFKGRTGRFYYDISFDRLSMQEIKEYVNDNVTETEVTDRLIALLHRLNANYDQLRAIVQELNFGESIENILRYLNIGLDDANTQDFEVIFRFKSGITYHRFERVDLIKPQLQFYVSFSRVTSSKQTYNYDFSFRATEEAFIFDGEDVSVDISKLSDVDDRNLCYDSEESSESIFGTIDDLESITLKVKSDEVKLAY